MSNSSVEAVNARNTARLQVVALLLKHIAKVNSETSPVNQAALAALEPVSAELARRERHGL